MLALAIRTGFQTTKGDLVRSILYPRPNKFRFYVDSMRFVGVMAIIAFLGFAASLPAQIAEGTETVDIVDKSLDLITITVPPALPMALTVGTIYAISRLQKSRIFCISQPRVNVSGRVNLFVFDKTGTLTDEGLEVHGFRPVEAHTRTHTAFCPFVHEPREIVDNSEFKGDLSLHAQEEDPRLVYAEEEKGANQEMGGSAYTAEEIVNQHMERTTKRLQQQFVAAMASCHCITRVEGRLIGDPLDVKLFESTKWSLEEGEECAQFDTVALGMVSPPTDEGEAAPPANESILSASGVVHRMRLALIRRFEFLAEKQRMSVLVRNLATQQTIGFVKGSPEKIRELSRPETVPANFHEILQIYTQGGYRVIAVAAKSIAVNFVQAQRLKRETVESDLTFLGLVVMENKLKAASARTIQTLQDAQIKTLMATGDNGLTAIAVGRDCGIINCEVPAYLGDLEETAEGRTRLVWTNVEQAKQHLEFSTLKIGQAPEVMKNYDEPNQKRNTDCSQISELSQMEDFPEIETPWDRHDDLNDFELAITGRAFNFLCDSLKEDELAGHGKNMFITA